MFWPQFFILTGDRQSGLTTLWVPSHQYDVQKADTDKLRASEVNANDSRDRCRRDIFSNMADGAAPYSRPGGPRLRDAAAWRGRGAAREAGDRKSREGRFGEIEIERVAGSRDARVTFPTRQRLAGGRFGLHGGFTTFSKTKQTFPVKKSSPK